MADIDVQEERCRSHAQEHGYQVVDVFRDEMTDPVDSRPELRRLRQAVWRRQMDVLLATTPDRLYYDANRLVRFAREAGLLGVRLEFLDFDLDLDGFERTGSLGTSRGQRSGRERRRKSWLRFWEQ